MICLQTENTPGWRTALSIGNEIRTQRAAQKRSIEAAPSPTAHRMVADVLRRCQEQPWRTMRVMDLLTLPKYATKSRARTWLAMAGASENKRLAELTTRQSLLLAEYAMDRAHELDARR